MNGLAMTQPFDDPRHKVENARDHIARVEQAFSDYLAANPEANSGRRWDGMGPQIINFGPQAPLPKKISLAAGDVLHNLRSALDIMAGDVVQESGKSRKGVYFPFGRDAAGVEEQIKKKHFDRALPEAIDLLRAMKPYNDGNPALRALHDLNVTDKHNWIIPAAKRNTVSDIRIGNTRMIGCSFSGNGTDIMVSGAVPIQVGSVSTSLIFANNQPLAGEEVIPTLHRLADLTRSIIEAFAVLFASQGNRAECGATT